jgi:hypothetical protein
MIDADTRFLKRILILLVAGTIATGTIAGITTVKTEQANRIASVAT